MSGAGLRRSALCLALLIAGCSDAAQPAKARKDESAAVKVERQRGAVHPCLMQGEEQLDPAPLRAVGTEPFWGAQIMGRCVTYSHLDDTKGTRIWTRYAETPAGPVWSGALDGRPFELRIRAAPECSDGMSDKLYPMSVELIVGGERRQGCAEPVP